MGGWRSVGLKEVEGILEQVLESGLLLCSWMLTEEPIFPLIPMKGCYCGFDSVQITDTRVALFCLLACCVRLSLVP